MSFGGPIEYMIVTNTSNNQFPTQSCRSLRFLKNGKESKMDETNGFVIKIDVQKRRFCPEEPTFLKRQNIYGISWLLYFLQ